MKFILYCVLLILCLSLQVKTTLLPLSFIVLLVWAIEGKSVIPLFFVFLIGLILDIIFLRIMGETMLYFLFVMTLVFLYERKFEVASFLFVTLVSFFSTLFYFFLFFQQFALLQSVLCAGFGLSLFLLMRYCSTPQKKTYSSLL